MIGPRDTSRSSADELSALAREPSIHSMSELIDRAQQSQNQDVMVCIAETTNAFLTGFFKLSGRSRLEASDMSVLFQQIKLMLSVPLAKRGPQEYAPRARNAGLQAVETGLLDQRAARERAANNAPLPGYGPTDITQG